MVGSRLVIALAAFVALVGAATATDSHELTDDNLQLPSETLRKLLCYQPLCCDKWDDYSCKCHRLKDYWLWDGHTCEFKCPHCCGECDYGYYTCKWWKDNWSYKNGKCSYVCPHCCYECDEYGYCKTKGGWWYKDGKCIKQRRGGDDDDDDGGCDDDDGCYRDYHYKGHGGGDDDE